MDMWKGYISSTRKHVPSADEKIYFDRFHVAKILGDALDKVRREEHRALRAEGDGSLTGTKHLLLRRGSSLEAHEEGVVDILRRLGLKTARAWQIKEAATKLWHYVRRTTLVVAPLMLTELATAIWLALWPPAPQLVWTTTTGLVLIVVVWLSTGLWQVPCHRQLERGLDPVSVRRLAATNWARTLAWTARAALALLLVVEPW